MTAPLPKTRTVLVVSEKGSRFSLPSAARTPLTVTGTSSATGCCLTAESADNVVADGGRCAVSGLAVRISLSLAVGGMGCTLATENFLGRPVPDRVPLEHLYVLPPGRGSTIVRAYYGGNTCPTDQAFPSPQAPPPVAAANFRRQFFRRHSPSQCPPKPCLFPACGPALFPLHPPRIEPKHPHQLLRATPTRPAGLRRRV